MITLSISEIKNKLSRYIAKTNTCGEYIIITKRKKPVAAIVGGDWIEHIKTRDEIRNLAYAAGKWKCFDEIAGEIDRAYRSRQSFQN